jgi:hypothetical protein
MLWRCPLYDYQVFYFGVMDIAAPILTNFAGHCFSEFNATSVSVFGLEGIVAGVAGVDETRFRC